MNNYPKKIVSIHAHPDDTEAFCSGALTLLKSKGYDITIVSMTAGGMGGINLTEKETISLRINEAEKAAQYLGAKYICLEQRDGFLYDSEKIRLKTIDLIRREKTGIVFTHLPFDYHIDHRITSQIVEIASMLSTLPNIPSSETPLEITPLLYHTSPLELTDPLGKKITSPHFFVDITEVIEKKMEMLSYHQTQIKLMNVMFKIDDFFDEMKKYSQDLGKFAKVSYAECFWQHMGKGFQKDPIIQEALKPFIVNG